MTDQGHLPQRTPLSDFVGMKHWSDEKLRWHGVICRVELENGKETVVVYDVEHKETQVEIDDWIDEAIRTKPWEKSEGGRQ